MALSHGLPLARLSFDAAINQDVRGLIVRDVFDSGFVYYALLGRRAALDIHIDRAAHGTARARETLYGHRIDWMPGLAEQRKIADFLDCEGERIGVALETASALGRRAREDLLSRAAAAVRLDDAPRRRLGYAFSFEAGKTLNARADTTGGELHPFIGTWHVRWGYVREHTYKYAPFTADERARLDLRVGDLLVNEGGAYAGRTGIVRRDMPGVFFQNHVHRLRAREGADPSFHRWVLQVAVERGDLLLDSLGIGLPNLSAARLRAVRVPAPAIPDQRAIGELLDRHEARVLSAVDSGIALAGRLTAYRDSLIHEAVTGKLDVSRVSEAEMHERLHAAAEDRLDEVVA